MVTQNVTLNGTSDFAAFGWNYSWDGAYMETAYFENSGSTTIDTLNLSLTGPVWRIRRLAFDSESDVARLNVVISDANDGIERRIDWLQLQDYGNTTITLHNSRIRFIDGGVGGNVTMTLGAGSLNWAGFWENANVTVNAGSGSVDTLYMSDTGTNIYNGGSGWLGLLEFGGGSNTFNGGTGNFGTIRAWGATNTMTFQNGGDSIVMGDGVNALTLNGGYFGAITSYSGTNTITVGANAEVRSIGFSGGVDIVTVRGGVDQIQLGSNNDRLVVGGTGQTYVGQALLGNGNNVLSMAGGWIGSVRANEGNDTVTITNASIDSLIVGGGTNNVTVNTGSDIGSLLASGNDTVKLKGDGRILTVKMDNGTNALSSETGFIESFVSYAARNTLTIGTGGIGEILIMGSPAAQTVTAAGWLGALQVYAGSLSSVQATTVTLGAGGAGYIQTSKGADVITTGAGSVDSINTYDGADRVTVGAGGVGSITTGIGNDTINAASGFVETILAGDGNDSVTTGASGAGFVSLGTGNDTLVMTRFTPADTMIVSGGDGTDTVNMTGFVSALRVSLAQPGLIQNVGAAAGVVTPALGFVGLSGIENVIGSAFADWIEGGAGANVLTGLGGSDTLSGLDGDDRLVGGRGNDSLIGGAGVDRFVFVVGDGTDRVADFVVGEDKVELREANALADLTFTKVGADVRVVFGTWTGIFEDITVAELRQSSNFLF